MSDKPKVAWMTGPGAGSWWLYKNWCLGCHCSRFKKWLIKLSQVDKIFQSSNLINFIRQSLFSNIFLDVISWHSAMYYTNSLYTIEMSEKYWCVLTAVVFGGSHLQLQCCAHLPTDSTLVLIPTQLFNFFTQHQSWTESQEWDNSSTLTPIYKDLGLGPLTHSWTSPSRSDIVYSYYPIHLFVKIHIEAYEIILTITTLTFPIIVHFKRHYPHDF